MAYSESTTEKIEVLSNGTINCECTVIIYKDDSAVASTKYTSCYFPGTDLSDAPEMVKKAASVFWTDDVISNYQQTVVAITS